MRNYHDMMVCLDVMSTMFPFKSDLSDFTEILEFYLTNEAAIRIITEKAYEHVKTFHTWERRIKELTGLISEIV